jgi:hypothetical protein
MSTENVEVFNRYYGNGVATQFSIGFPYLKREFVKVYLYKKDTDEEKVLNSDQFSFVNDATIQYPVLPTDEILKEGDILTIQRETTLGSEFEFDNQRRLFPVEVMNADDLAFQQIQELSREIKRAVRVNPTAAQQPEELLTEVYDKLDSATEVANEAIAAATQATTAAGEATQAVERANSQIAETQEYIDNAKTDIDATVDAAKQEINTTIDEAQMDLSDTIQQAVEDVKQEAIKAADETIQATIGGSVDEAANYAKESKAWARGEDADVEEFAPGENEHSSRGYADLAMAIANTPENVPVDASKLLALDVIRGPKGDSGEAEFSGDVTFTGTFDVHSDSNHPLKVTGMAGTSASGFQIVDSNGLGDSDFEHYATGDRYGTRITNHNNTSNTSVSVDLYQSNVGRSVLDTTDVETVLVPTPAADDDSQKAVNSEWVNDIVDAKTLKTSQITNCITEIPQDIKLELNDGTLTLKAGSKVYVPNGFEADGVTPKFDVVMINSDLTRTAWTSGSVIVYYDRSTNALRGSLILDTLSGETSPTSGNKLWYDTINNKIKWFASNGSLTTYDCSLPVGVFTTTSSSFTSIDQVFNGFGYIGSTVFALPGVKGLIPNGRNADGSLRNIEIGTTNVITKTTGYTFKTNIGITSSKELSFIGVNDLPYNEEKNYFYFNGSISSQVVIGTCQLGSPITNFQPKLPFHAVDYNEASGLGMPSGKYINLTLGASGTNYTAPANGWFYLSGTSANANQYVAMGGDVAMNNISTGSGQLIQVYIPILKGHTMQATYNTSTTGAFRFIYAEGEN